MKIHYLDKYLQSPMHPVTIALVGCGGTGSNILTQLGRINYCLQELDHPGLFVKVFDPDQVSQSNIGRQLFAPEDIGINKAQVLTTRLNRFYGTQWISYPSELLMKEIKSNIVISCVDTIESRKNIFGQIQSYQEYSKEEKLHDPYKLKYWIDTGNTRDTGQVILGTPGKIEQPKKSSFTTVSKLEHFFDIYPDIEDSDDEKLQGPTCSIAQALQQQDLFINSTIAQYTSNMLFKLLHDRMTAYRGVFLNNSEMRSNPIKL